MGRLALTGCALLSLWLAPAAAAGDGTFGAREGFAVGDGPVSVAVGDFDSDGRPDLVTANGPGESLTVLRGLGGGLFGQGSDIVVGRSADAVAVADFDEDGDDDLAFANAWESRVSVLIGTGTGAFGPAAHFPVGASSPIDLAVADLDADGSEDLVTVSHVSDQISTLLGDGAGGFGASAERAVGNGPSGLAIGDFDGDGLDDVATANSFADNVTVELGDGTGGFRLGGSAAAVDDEPNAIAVGDFNADARDDLVVANGSDQSISIVLAGEDGELGAAEEFGLGRRPRSLAVADFDSDGNADVAVGTTGPVDAATIRLGDGEGALGPAISYPVGEAPSSILVEDFDADGNADLAATNQVRDAVGVLLGGGSPRLEGNLLVNGGAEGAGAARTLAAAPAVPGWNDGQGSMTHVRYSSFGGFPRRIDSARWEGGSAFFSGGPGGLTGGSGASEISQTVPLPTAAVAGTDAGLATARLAADIGGRRAQGDTMRVTATFLGAGREALGSMAVGPVSATERVNTTQLRRRVGAAPLPPGTREISVELRATREARFGYVDGYADNVKLTVDAPEPPAAVGVEAAGGEDGGGAEAGGEEVVDRSAPETVKGKGPKRRIRGSVARFEFSSSEPGSTFECRLDRGPARPCTAPAAVRRLKRGKHAFLVTAIDAAGNRDPSPAAWRFKRTVRRRR